MEQTALIAFYVTNSNEALRRLFELLEPDNDALIDVVLDFELAKLDFLPKLKHFHFGFVFSDPINEGVDVVIVKRNPSDLYFKAISLRNLEPTPIPWKSG